MMCKKIAAPNKKLSKVIATAFLLLAVAGFTTQAFASVSSYTSENIPHSAGIMDEQSKNLQKLCKVWGFAKYTHMAFLTGEKDWDEELLKLIPIIQSVSEEDVNNILYDWFIGLGDDGYDDNKNIYLFLRTNEFDDLSEQEKLDIMGFPEQISGIPWLSLLSGDKEFGHYIYFIMIEEINLPAFQEMAESFSWMASLTFAEETDMHYMADMRWITDISYLGEPLVSAFARFKEIPIIDRGKSPINFGWNNNSDFILDMDWNALLLDYIPKMMEVTDKLGYETTLAALACHLHDAHIGVDFGMVYIRENFGRYSAPVSLTVADERLVVNKIDRASGSSLMQGDVILKMNGRDIYDVSEEMLQYLNYPNDEKALEYITNYLDILRSHTEDMEVSVIRDGVKLELTVKGYAQGYYPFARSVRITPTYSHKLLENNIGLINPSKLAEDEIHDIMMEFTNTDGLIIDLRQYPSTSIAYPLAEYMVDTSQPFVKVTRSSPSVPGVFMELLHGYSGGISGEYNFDTYFYDKKVVLLIGITTMSQGEFTTMALRNGSNITVMGSNSMGADGNVTYLPLPSGIIMQYIGMGVYTPEGGQTQRIGLSPDIYVERTIEGIKEGRDELMEAAIEFILE